MPITYEGIEFPDHCTPMDTLVAVASKRLKDEFPEDVQDSPVTKTKTTTKNKKVGRKKKNESVTVSVKKHKIEKQESSVLRKRKRSSNVEPTVSPELPEEFIDKIEKQESNRVLRKRKSSSNVEPKNLRKLPVEFITAIDELNGGKDFTGEVMYVIEKTLTHTDLTKRTNCLNFSFTDVKCGEFLKEDEKEKLETNIGDSFMEVMIIEPSLELSGVNLGIWDMTGKLHYVLNGQWMDIFKRNELKVGDTVHLWAFRINGELCFALGELEVA